MDLEGIPHNLFFSQTREIVVFNAVLILFPNFHIPSLTARAVIHEHTNKVMELKKKMVMLIG